MDDKTDLTPPPPPPPPPPPLPRRRPLLGRRGATAAVASGLVIGGIAGGYVITQAATASPSATTTPSATPGPSTSAPGAPTHPGGDCAGGGGGRASRAEDQQVVASAIGISTTQLRTEETAGKTIATIATEHNVAVSKVISALVASENAEIDQRVSSGQITAAQGAQQKTTTTQRVTAEVNGTRPAGGQPDGPPVQR